MINITNEELTRAKAILAECTVLKDALGQEWQTEAFSIARRNKQKPLFWIFLNDWLVRRLNSNLSILKENCVKFTRIATKLRDLNDYCNMLGLLGEIEVVAYYYTQFEPSTIEYEPVIEGTGKKADLRININNVDYYIEICSLQEDAVGRELDELQQKIREALDEISQPFVISVTTNLNFVAEDSEAFISFVKSLISHPKTIVPQQEYHFLKGTEKFGNVRFSKTVDGQGFVGFLNQPIRTLITGGRLKQKILGELDQLPVNGKNIIVVDMSNEITDFIDFENAVLGEAAVNINVQTKEATWVRNPNGLVHHKKFDQMSMIIGYVRHDYSTRKSIINASASNPIEESISKRF